jgi:hypothetical protein
MCRTSRRAKSRAEKCLAAVLLLALAGCSGRIWRDQVSPDGITYRWYTNEVSMDEVSAEAVRHCSAYGRRPQLVRVFEDQDMSVANYVCATP